MMRQRYAETLAPEEPDAFIAHVRVCGGAGWVTTGSTRKLTGKKLTLFTSSSALAFGSPRQTWSPRSSAVEAARPSADYDKRRRSACG